MTRHDAVRITTEGAIRSGKRKAAMAGAAIGCALALTVSVLIGWGLDTWRCANDERLRAEAVAAVDARLGDCRKDLARLNEIKEAELAYLNRRPGP
jgi:hypothetical protein